jgi:Protein of unknown function (DUF2924)
MPSPSFDREAIEAEIDRVRSLCLDGLRTLWCTTFRSSPPPAFTKDLIARFLCRHIQEQALGGLDPETTRHLASRARGNRSRADRPRRLKTGTVLLREYQGERHTVTVVANGLSGARRPMPASPPSPGPSPVRTGMDHASLASGSTGRRSFCRTRPMCRPRHPTGDVLLERPALSPGGPSPDNGRLVTPELHTPPLVRGSRDHEAGRSKTATLCDLYPEVERA